jgi:hypothetical protein
MRLMKTIQQRVSKNNRPFWEYGEVKRGFVTGGLKDR